MLFFPVSSTDASFKSDSLAIVVSNIRGDMFFGLYYFFAELSSVRKKFALSFSYYSFTSFFSCFLNSSTSFCNLSMANFKS
jgi:hypothetical protein